MKHAWLLALAMIACTPSRARAPSKPAAPTIDPDRAACDRLCAKERACSGEGAKDCDKSCAADAARMKAGFVAAYVGCFEKLLDAKCASFDDRARDDAHLECFDLAVARFPRDEQNQRDMAEPVCDRGERCMGLGKLGRDACMQATLDPQEPEVKLGQRLVDALRRERVVEFRTCVDRAPCPGLDSHDDAVDQCYARTIAGGP